MKSVIFEVIEVDPNPDREQEQNHIKKLDRPSNLDFIRENQIVLEEFSLESLQLSLELIVIGIILGNCFQLLLDSLFGLLNLFEVVNCWDQSHIQKLEHDDKELGDCSVVLLFYHSSLFDLFVVDGLVFAESEERRISIEIRVHTLVLP